MSTLQAIDPTTGRVTSEVSTAGPAEVEATLARAKDAFAGWRDTPIEQRAEVLRAVAERLRDRRGDLAPLMTREMGKPITEARGEVEKAAWAAEHYAEHAAEYLADERLASDATESWVQYLPLGPVLGILPWNAPFWLALRFAAPALMAGNPCVMKHDPHVPDCATAIEEVFTAAGLPAGVFQALHLPNEEVEAVIRDPRIRAVSFTGSDRAGAKVAAVAASEIKPSVLELGGSDPFVVLADADLERAAEVAALSRIINAGQSCIAAKRIIVERSVHDRFVELLRPRLEALVVGDPADEATQVGPLAREDLREHLHDQVRRTVAEGATCVLGGELPAGEGWFYPVTLLTGVEPGMAACREETFGPVATVVAAEDAADALRLANDTPYGLGASVWTTTDRGVEMARQVEAGQVSVNGIVKTDPRLPSGGIKRSGYGRELGPHGIREFVNAQQVWVGPATG
ncbi:succinate-semialdehyde dehydrogenase / glutarate-semialdehyde dehydrogenase [Kytococcus aerolatus]|uniref:Succinate-semialdehyde dehydrogenase / glutarate-semialdehyde dehydrogenase n=1 Tax=Kytococcus aerolatus TaxID=592308 RepID=A0A212U220_9MICO|nr:NAD-dependent succinate-semialdehyde dehydrogenase [Kytococcus aerolatus]SNC72176.1 succinate-semialdehyde dehydrogenase / glutarate-semialdehyde dehydrogenase [Kytococcus aerolatus]